ncbi:hypothetical protein K435DRAFT_776501 [Dendrothele bispora CBS 962.96]|uniref:Uncharacterized protein n=1 Tax=Dendrothele bispora (strain CBS 962.96) TaxID=1314807 RepID=A0A4S8MDH7_DENBC|nr:hypothetical protein K435DRAFT_776501 [Dendrothele bispora CBS 962.96]
MTASFLDHLQILHINPAVAVGRTGCLRPNSEACSEQCCCYFGKEYFDAAKRRIQASIKKDSNGDSYDRTVLTWVKIYVGGERVVEKREDIEDGIVKKKSKWPILRSAKRLFVISTSSRLRKK